LSRKVLILILKLLIAAALILFVLNKIDLVDRYEIIKKTGPTETVVSRVEGKIVGNWQARPVLFLSKGTTKTKELHPGVLPNGETLALRPGLLTYLKGMNIPVFLFGALFFFIVATFSSVRWWWLLRVNDLKVSVFEAFRLTWIGIFFNNVVPGLTGGDVIKAFYIARKTGKKARPIVTVLVDRVLGLAALAFLAGLVLLFNFKEFWEVALGIYVGLFLLALGAIAYFSRRIRKIVHLDALLQALPMANLFQQLDQAVSFYRHHVPGLASWFFLSVGNHFLAVLGVALIGDSLGVGVPWTSYFVLIPVINILSAVPLTPSGWGVGEALYGFFFKKYCAHFLVGIANAGQIIATRAIALSVVYRIHLMLWSILGALFLLFERGKAPSPVLPELTEESTSS
jgi:uncharacterized protein (TIRG00374 family)